MRDQNNGWFYRIILSHYFIIWAVRVAFIKAIGIGWGLPDAQLHFVYHVVPFVTLPVSHLSARRWRSLCSFSRLPAFISCP